MRNPQITQMNTDYKKHTPQIEDQRNQLTQIEDCQTYKNTQSTSPQQKDVKKTNK